MNATRPLGFWLKLVDSLIDEQFAATLEEHGVTRRHKAISRFFLTNLRTFCQQIHPWRQDS